MNISPSSEATLAPSSDGPTLKPASSEAAPILEPASESSPPIETPELPSLLSLPYYGGRLRSVGSALDSPSSSTITTTKPPP
jgi:hypothetical protein